MIGPDLHLLAVAFALVLTRVSGLMVTVPFLSIEIAPVRTRAALALVLAGLLTFGAPSAAAEVRSVGALAVAMLGELLLGALTGLVVRIALAAAELAGEVVGMQMGFGFARTVNPLMEEQSGALTRLISVTAGLLFFLTGAHRLVVGALAQSLHAVPAGSVSPEPGWSEMLVDQGGAMFVAGLRIALPLVVTVMASHMVFGLLTRVAPQLNLWAVGFLVSISVGLLGLTVFAPALVVEVRTTLEDGVSTALGVGGR